MNCIKLRYIIGTALLIISIFNSAIITFAAGWVKDEQGTWYYQLEDGTYKEGWQRDDGKWYYLDPEMVIGWKKIGDYVYYFDTDGHMIKNEKRYIKDQVYEFGSTGAVIGKMPSLDRIEKDNQEIKKEEQLKNQQQTKQEKKESENNDNSKSNSAAFKYATNASLLNTYLNMCLQDIREIDNSEKDGNTARIMIYANVLAGHLSTFETALNSSYSIDKIYNNHKGVEEETTYLQVLPSLKRFAVSYGATLQ